MQDNKQIIVMSWTDEKILTIEVFDYPKQEQESWDRYKELLGQAEDQTAGIYSKEHFFETFVKPQNETTEK